MSIDLELVDPSDTEQMLAATRDGIANLREAAEQLGCGYEAPAFAQELARTLHMNAGRLRYFTARMPFPKPVRRQLCREIGEAMRELWEFL